MCASCQCSGVSRRSRLMTDGIDAAAIAFAGGSSGSKALRGTFHSVGVPVRCPAAPRSLTLFVGPRLARGDPSCVNWSRVAVLTNPRSASPVQFERDPSLLSRAPHRLAPMAAQWDGGIQQRRPAAALKSSLPLLREPGPLCVMLYEPGFSSPALTTGRRWPRCTASSFGTSARSTPSCRYRASSTLTGFSRSRLTP